MLALVTTTGCALLHRHPHERPSKAFGTRFYCKARKAERYVGMIASDGVARAARFHAEAAEVKRFGPGEPVVPEHRAGRLVLAVDAEGRIAGVSCR